MGFIDNFRKAIDNLASLSDMLDMDRRAQVEAGVLQYNYYIGAHRRQLRVKDLQADDNIALNLTGIVVNRGVSMLMSGGVEFDFQSDAAQEYIYQVWDANNGDILRYKLAQNGAIYGTCYVKILPDAIRGEDGNVYPRLVALDPLWMTVETDPEDMERVTGYIVRFIVEMNGQETSRKSVIRPLDWDDVGEPVAWTIEELYSNKSTNNQWQPLVEPITWPYPFAPIIHWQNMPMQGVYGQSDIAGVIDLQDRINFVGSNISKIIRYHAHPKTWGRGATASDKQSWGADEMVIFRGDNAQIANLEMQSDLASSMTYMRELRQTLFDQSQTVDLTSVSDKLGSLTNFGLRVLYSDALAKLKMKQELYGEAFEQLNFRLQVLANMPSPEYGEAVWPDPLPVNEVEQNAKDQFELDNKIVSIETVSKRRGYVWEDEQERIQGEQVALGDNVGAAILRAFNTGQ